MASCEICGADLKRGLGPFESPHHQAADAVDADHLRPGAQGISVDIGKARRIELNRIAKATGVNVSEQIRRALDAWIAGQRVDVEPAGTGEGTCGRPAGGR